MKRILLLPLLTIHTLLLSQETVNLSLAPTYANQIYYSLENGVQETVSLNSWDLAFSTSSFGSSIRFNGATSSELYIYPNGTINEWSIVDTNGLSLQKPLYDSDTSWLSTAFNLHPQSDFDLGWGQYSVITHIVSGDSIYITKIGDDYKKFYIDRLQSGTYYLVHANLNGSDSTTTEIKKSDYIGKNSVYFSFSTNSVLDLEPSSDSWDLIFTKYIATLDGGINYGVTGVLLNNGVTAGKVTDGSTINEVHENTHTYDLQTKINTIGYNWKTFDFNTFSFLIEDSLVFVVKDKSDVLWNLEFLSFSGSSSGDFSFNKIQQQNVTGLFNPTLNDNQMSIYPNPVQHGQSIHIESTMTENSKFKIYNQSGEIIFITNELDRLESKSSELESGFYLIEQESNQPISTQRLTIY